MSLLTIVQDAASLVGLAKPATTASADTSIAQLVALAQQEGDELSRRHDWRGLVIPASITGTGTATDFDLPTDFQRLVSGPALWRQNALVAPLAGPASSAEWTAITQMVTMSIDRVYRLLSGTIQVWPAPATTDVIRLEYVSTHWISSSDRTVKRLRWSTDTDYALVPERLVTLGVVWRWKRQKGLSYDEERATYEDQVAYEASADRGARDVAFVGPARDGLPGFVVPETIAVS